jgi:hypothetical protein
MPWLRTGTVAVNNGSTTVTGTGTNFAANSRVGDAFIGPDGRQYEVANVASALVISILPAYQGANATGAAYAVMPVQGYQKLLADQVRDWVNSYGPKMAALGTTGNYDVLPLEKGGTGAQSALDARAALGVINASRGYICGLEAVWTSSNSMTIRPGAVYLPSVGRVVESSVDISLPGQMPAASSIYHLYAYESNGALAIELNQVTPSKYTDSASIKSGDISRRYLSSVLINSSGGFVKFYQRGDSMLYADIGDGTGSPFLLFSSASSVPVTVNTRAMSPNTAWAVKGILVNLNTTGTLRISLPSVGTVSVTSHREIVRPATGFTGEILVDPDGTFSCMVTAGDANVAQFRANGYRFWR